MGKILVVEDEFDIRELIKFNLEKENHQVVAVADGLEALAYINRMPFDLILLDVMLPKIDGISICRKIKEDTSLSKTPVIVLSAKNLEEDILKGLEHGADDYISKPFSMKILLAKVKTQLKRIEESVLGAILLYDRITLNLDKRETMILDNKVELTFSEFEFLRMLIERVGYVWSRAHIVEKLRGSNHAITDRAVDVLVVGLRKKLGEYGGNVETVRGVGYRLKEVGNS